MKRIVTGSSGISGPHPGVHRKFAKAAGFVAAAVLCFATITAPDLAQARGGGGGFGGGFHGGDFGGFHGAGGFGGFHAGGSGGFHSGAVGQSHSSGFSGGESAQTNAGFRSDGLSGSGLHPDAPSSAGMNGFRADGGGGGSQTGTVVLRGGDPHGQLHHDWRGGRYGSSWGYDPYLWSDDGLYDGYDGLSQTDASQYYCSDPAGYYPAVTQCSSSWQTVPAN